MNCCFASINTKGFQSSLESGRLPEPDHITYEGAFNQLKFTIGQKAKEPMELYLGYARSQYSKSCFDNKINDYLAIFTKGSKDGEDRDGRVLNSVIVLDISGSMDGALSSKGEGNRLKLSKEAIKMFYSKLRPNDSFGLVLFNTHGQTLIPCTRKSQANDELFFGVIDTIQTNGGTTLLSGFQEGQRCLNNYLKGFNKTEGTQNRILMLTDVGDNSIVNAYAFVKKVQQSGIHVTIIGISDEFKSSYCQKMNQIQGFNYFCATQVSDLKKYLFENFSFTFFPSNYNIQISLESAQVNRFEVFGTPDCKRVNDYNAHTFGKQNSKFIITKTKTSFPSQIETDQKGILRQYGGLIVVKLNLRQIGNTFDGKILLSYNTPKGEKHLKQYPIHYESPIYEQYYSDQALSEAMQGFHYVFEVKNILIKLQTSKNNKQLEKTYIDSLIQLKKLAPKSKIQELQKMIDTLKKRQQNHSKNMGLFYDQ